jgi:YesN/AraC family two-component response regulator
MDDYLAKPIDKAVLQDVFAMVIAESAFKAVESLLGLHRLPIRKTG